MTDVIAQAPGGRPSAIAGIGSYRPRRVVGSDEVAARLGVEAGWITSRTGVHRRRKAGPDEPLVAMAAQAGRAALDAAGMAAAELDVVIVATVTNPRAMPGTAPQVAAAVGAERAVAFDVGSACSGFCVALENARSLIAGDGGRAVLVVGADRMLDITDPDDPSTAALFGDGAAAVVVAAADRPGIGKAVWGSDGSRAGAVECRPPRPAFVDPPDAPTGHATRMEGREVIEWVRGVVVADDVTESGNCGAASVPLALDALIGSGRISLPISAVLIGFGSGLTYAGQVVALPAGLKGRS
ncbi:ketoacyl-ACP synthase III [Actinomadura rubrisoli]|uniref:Ketoacyl-ACP synthase III n=1 Tax=Actinomadura rubrisoli TaxID=2530368 RepID=A0A4V2YVT2_9ACTN|nr:ketoacyl-ACP synthase III [Actinomadura rubrisoli]TDD82677.1 ketoacyl-ACP synthase III [Actinomadura rubrisoli]